MGRKGFENPGLDGEKVEFPFAPDVDQPACLQFLDVVGERCWRDSERFAGDGTGERTVGAGDAFEEFEALWIRKGFEEGGALGTGEANGCCGANLC